MKYKVGDKVRVRSDLKTGNKYGLMIFTPIMENLTGKVATIKEVKNISYLLEENEKPWWTDEMFEGLAEEKPTPKFKIGDRVKLIKATWGDTKVGDTGTIVAFGSGDPGVEFDRPCGGHDCACKGKDGHCWWIYTEELEIIKDETPTPEPIQVNVNINININYDNACWYCRKGGVVDLYFKGQPGICPHCGRVCNAATAEMTKSQ